MFSLLQCSLLLKMKLATLIQSDSFFSNKPKLMPTFDLKFDQWRHLYSHLYFRTKRSINKQYIKRSYTIYKTSTEYFFFIPMKIWFKRLVLNEQMNCIFVYGILKDCVFIVLSSKRSLCVNRRRRTSYKKKKKKIEIIFAVLIVLFKDPSDRIESQTLGQFN